MLGIYLWLLATMMHVCVCEYTQSSLDPMDCSPPGSPVHGIFQARIMEWVIVSFSSHYGQCMSRTHQHYWIPLLGICYWQIKLV